jgi:hypothetical protein
MPLVSYREYARMQGIKLSSLQDRIKRGGISEQAIDRTSPHRPKIITEIADVDWQARRSEQGHDSDQMARPRPTQKPPELNPIDEMFGPPKIKFQKSVLDKKVQPLEKPTTKIIEINGEMVEALVEPGVSPDSNLYFNKYKKAKAGTEELKGRLLELQVEELENRLLDKKEVKDTIEKLVSLTREKLLNLPSKISSDLIAVTQIHEMESKLYEQINAALEDLAKVGVQFE